LCTFASFCRRTSCGETSERAIDKSFYFFSQKPPYVTILSGLPAESIRLIECLFFRGEMNGRLSCVRLLPEQTPCLRGSRMHGDRARSGPLCYPTSTLPVPYRLKKSHVALQSDLLSFSRARMAFYFPLRIVTCFRDQCPAWK